jgi:hypothetical protein
MDRWQSREKQLRAQFRLPLGLIERTAMGEPVSPAAEPKQTRDRRQHRSRSLLFGLLTLVSYVDRLYQEIGKFLSREFQDNIDAFEQIVEPRLGVTRERASLSMAILTQLVTAAIAMIVGFTVFRDRAWSIYEVLEATLSLVLIIIVLTVCCRSCFSRDPGTLAGRLGTAAARADLPGSAGHAGAGILPVGGALTREHAEAQPETSRPKPWTR